MHHHQLTRKLQDKDGWIIYRGRHDDTNTFKKHHLWHTIYFVTGIRKYGNTNVVALFYCAI